MDNNKHHFHSNATDLAEQPEELFYRRHSINLLVPILVTFAMVTMLSLVVWSLMVSPGEAVVTWSELMLFAGLVLFMIMSYFMTEWIFWYFDTWVVTPEKLIDSQLVSFFRHNRSEMPLRQVQDISFEVKGVLATLFGCGDITIQTAAKQTYFKLLYIYHPEQAVRRISSLVQQAVSEVYGHAGDTANTATPILLGELLIKKGLIMPVDLAVALEEQKKSGLRLGKIFINQTKITKQDLLNALSVQHCVPVMDLDYVRVDPAVINCLTRDLVLKYRVMPLFKSPNNVLMMAVDNFSDQLVRNIKDACGAPVEFVVADEDKIQKLISEYYPQ
jgi:membrane protein YdbS with pleckstrin-like domain